MKRRIAIGIFFSVLFIYLSFWKPNIAGLFRGSDNLYSAFFGHPKIDLHQLGEALAQAQYIYLIFGILLLLISLFPRAQRWRILLTPVASHLRFRSVYNAMNIGYMINNVLPLRMGEIYRAYVLGRAENISKTSALATIVVERLVDILAGVALLAVTIFFFPFPEIYGRWLLIFGLGVVLAFAFLLSLLISTERTIRLLTVLLRPVPTKISAFLLRTLESFSNGLQILRSARHYMAIFMYTIILQLIYIFSSFLTLTAFHLVDPAFPKIYENPILAAIVLLIFNTIGIAIPSAPGAVGTLHYFVASGVQLFGVPAGTAMGVAIMLHLAQYIPLTLLGLGCFWSQHFKLSEMKSQLPQDHQTN